MSLIHLCCLSFLLTLCLLCPISAHTWCRVTEQDTELYSIEYHTPDGKFQPGCKRTFSFTSTISGALAFNVTVERWSQLPIISSQYNNTRRGGSINTYNFNSAYVPLFDGGTLAHALLVRSQNKTSSSSNKLQGTASPSMLFMAYDVTGVQSFANIVENDKSMWPTSDDDDFGVEDPRIAYNLADRTYYLLYTAATTHANSPEVFANLAVATTTNPRDSSLWQRRGHVRKDGKWSKSGSLLIRQGNYSLLFFGDSNNGQGMEYATTTDLISYTVQPGIWLPVRKDHFDNILVEGGPAPERLSTGQYFYVHNSAGHLSVNGSDYTCYHVGFVILDDNDPTKILFRTPVSILDPELGWEIGLSNPWLKLTPYVVFTEGMRPFPEAGRDTFLFYYGAADSVMGAAIATVHITDDGRSTHNKQTTATKTTQRAGAHKHARTAHH